MLHLYCYGEARILWNIVVHTVKDLIRLFKSLNVDAQIEFLSENNKCTPRQVNKTAFFFVWISVSFPQHDSTNCFTRLWADSYISPGNSAATMCISSKKCQIKISIQVHARISIHSGYVSAAVAPASMPLKVSVIFYLSFLFISFWEAPVHFGRP